MLLDPDNKNNMSEPFLSGLQSRRVGIDYGFDIGCVYNSNSNEDMNRVYFSETSYVFFFYNFATKNFANVL